MNDIYISKNYIKRDLSSPFYLFFCLILAFIYWPISLIAVVIFVGVTSQITTIFTLDNKTLTISYPYRFLGEPEKFLWSEIKETRIKKYGTGGYGSMPFMNIYLTSGEKQSISFNWMDEEDFDGLTNFMMDKIGKDKFVIDLY